ncbi:MAG: tetratricopeptide repeat protein [Actinobacteria bacterium]|nr:tetratricopeptide repeat protein [Actinomycetota bacterium]
MARRRINKRLLLILVGLLVVMVGLLVGMWHGKWRRHDPLPYLARGDGFYSRGRFSEAASQYQRAKSWAGRNGDTATQAIALLRLSQVLPHLETEQAVGRALGCLSQAVSKDPTNLDVRKARLDMQYAVARDTGSLDRWQNLKVYAEDVLNLDPQNARAHYLAGLSEIALSEIRRDSKLAMLESRREALPYFQKACQYAPKSVQYYRMLCRTYLNIASLIARIRSPLPPEDRQLIIDNWYKADHAARQFLSWNPDSGSAMVLLSNVLALPQALVVRDIRNHAVERSEVGALSDQELLEDYLESFRLDSPRPPLSKLLTALDRMTYGYLQAGQKLDSDHLSVQLALADYWLSANRRDLGKAVASLQKAVEYEQDIISKLRIYLRIADVYSRDAQPERALEVYEEALALPVDLKTLRASVLRQSIYELHLSAARTLLTLAAKLNRAETDSVERTNALLDKAEEHLESGNTIAGGMVTNYETLILRGSIALTRRPRTRQNVRDAIRKYEQARDQMESMDLSASSRRLMQYVNLHKSLAMAYDLDGQSGSAEETLTKGIDTVRQLVGDGYSVVNPRVLLYLLELQLKNGHMEKAEQGLISLLDQLDSAAESADAERSDLIAKALMLRVRLYRSQNKIDSALRTADEIIKRFPNYALWAISTQAKILGGDPDREAQLEALLQRWIQLYPDSPAPWALLADVYLRQDQGEKATQILKDAVSRNPKLRDSLSMLIEITQLENYDDRLELQIKQVENIADPLQRHMGLYRLYRGASAYYQRQNLKYRLAGQLESAKEFEERFTKADRKALSALEQAYEISPDTPSIYEPLLSVYLALRDWSKAQTLVDRAKVKNWDGVEGAYFQGRLHFAKARSLIAEDPDAARQEYQRSLSYLERAVLDRPAFYQAWSYKSAVETNLGRHEDALVSAQQAVKQNPSSVQALEVLMTAMANEWRRAAASDDPTSATRYAEQTYATAERIMRLRPSHARARAYRLSYLDSFDPERAITERLDILKSVPGNRNNLLALIAVYQRQHQMDRVKQLLIDLIAQQPDSPDLVGMLVQFYNQDRQYDKALEWILPAQQRWPDRIELVTLLAETYRLSNQSAKAVACLEGFLTTAGDQQKWMVYRSLGMLHKQLSLLDKSAEDFRQAIANLKKSQPSNSRAICDMARRLFSVNAQQEALDIISALAEQDDQYAVQTLVALYRQSAQSAEAIKWAQKALELAPESASAKISLAGALLDAGRPEQAQSILEETISQLGDNPAALAKPYIMLSDAHFMQRQYDTATQLLEDAINSGVNVPAVRIRLANYYRFQGRFEDASQQYYLILQKYSGNTEARMALVDSLIRQGSYSQAERILAEGRSIEPDAYNWPQRLSSLWMVRNDEPLKKRYDKALKFALEAHAKSGRTVSTAVSVMSIYNARAEYKQCEDFYRAQVSAKQKDQYPILLRLAWAWAGKWRQGKLGTVSMSSAELTTLQRQAVDLFHQVLDKSMDNDDIGSYIAAIGGLVAIRGMDNLILSTEESLRGDSENPRIRILLATLLNRRAAQRLNNRQTATAQEDLDRVVSLLEPLLDDGDLSNPLRLGVYSQLAISYTYLKMDEQAKDTYLSLLKFNPDNVRALNNVAYILSNSLNKPKEALLYIERALRQDPKEANLLDTYGWTLFKAGEPSRAVMELRRSVDILPTAVSYYHLGAALHAVGESQLALNALRESAKLLENDPLNDADIGNDVRTLIAQLEKN